MIVDTATADLTGAVDRLAQTLWAATVEDMKEAGLPFVLWDEAKTMAKFRMREHALAVMQQVFDALAEPDVDPLTVAEGHITALVRGTPTEVYPEMLRMVWQAGLAAGRPEEGQQG